MKKRKFILLSHAQTDLRELWYYVYEDNGTTRADRLVNRIAAKFSTLAEMPTLGRPRDELRPGLRSHAVGKYLIFYTTLEDTIEIVRILYGGRDLEALFQEDDDTK